MMDGSDQVLEIAFREHVLDAKRDYWDVLAEGALLSRFVPAVMPSNATRGSARRRATLRSHRPVGRIADTRQGVAWRDPADNASHFESCARCIGDRPIVVRVADEGVVSHRLVIVCCSWAELSCSGMVRDAAFHTWEKAVR